MLGPRLLLIIAALTLSATALHAEPDDANLVGVETVKQPAPPPKTERRAPAEAQEAIAASRTCRAQNGPKTLTCDVGGHFTINTQCGCRDQTTGKIYYGTVYP